jgi:cytochrome oxidase Cu insertion factor (SCO1/SenC/PrrC family)
MRSYGASHTGRYSGEKFEHWEFTTGSADEVKRIAEFFGVRYFKDASTGEEQVVHSLRTAVLIRLGSWSNFIAATNGNLPISPMI